MRGARAFLVAGGALLLAGGALLPAACDLPTECSLAACGDPIEVQLVGVDMAVEDPVLTMHAEGMAPVAMDCFGDGLCSPAAPIGAQRPDEVTLVLELADTAITRDFSPDYERYYPNGRDCGPTCWLAEVTFTVE